jgi:DNA-binding SARP family transcriptional activator
MKLDSRASMRRGGRGRALRSLPPDQAEVRLQLLGGFEVRCEGLVASLPLGPQRLVTYLALQDRPLLRTHIASVLWPDATEDHARGNLRSALWRLNHPRFSLVDVSTSHLRLAQSVVVDLREATAFVRGLLHQTIDFLDLDLGGLVEAGELLPDWYDDWVLVERERFRQLRLHALERGCERLTAAKRFGEAVEAGLAAVAAEPLRESAHRALIKLYLAEGNHGEALGQYRRCVELLRRELGVEPTWQLRDLVRLDVEPTAG